MEVKIQIPDNCELIKDGDTYIVKGKKNDKPRTWKEFCENYPVRVNECYINSTGKYHTTFGNCDTRIQKNWCTSKQEAEAFLALMQLRQLRKAWVGDWEQPNSHSITYVIKYDLDTNKVRLASGNFWVVVVFHFQIIKWLRISSIVLEIYVERLKYYCRIFNR